MMILNHFSIVYQKNWNAIYNDITVKFSVFINLFFFFFIYLHNRKNANRNWNKIECLLKSMKKSVHSLSRFYFILLLFFFIRRCRRSTVVIHSSAHTCIKSKQVKIRWKNYEKKIIRKNISPENDFRRKKPIIFVRK